MSDDPHPLEGEPPKRRYSMLFDVQDFPGRVATHWSVSDFRNGLLGNTEHGVETPDEEFVYHCFDIAWNAILDGHSFELTIPKNNQLIAEFANHYQYLAPLVPYPAGTPIFMSGNEGGPPLMFLCGGDLQTGRFNNCFVCYPGVLDSGYMTLLPVAALAFSFLEEKRRYMLEFLMESEQKDIETLETVTSLAIAALAAIADDRQPLERVEAPLKLNKARERRGKKPIPPMWKVSYITYLNRPHSEGGQRANDGGTHASPRPHDRRGHTRHIKSGREVWVRPSRIGEIERHLIRDRAFYSLVLRAKQ